MSIGARWTTSDRNVASLTGELLRERFGMTGLPAVMSRTWLVGCLADLGEFDEGIARGDEAIRLAEAAEHPFSLTQAYYALGTLFLRQGNLPKAIPVLERGLGLCQAAAILTWFPSVAAALGYAYTLSERVSEALPLLQQAVAQDTSRGIAAGHARRVANLSEAYLLAGRRDEAVDLATSALTFARTLKARGNEAYALWLHGEIHAQQEPLAGEASRRLLSAGPRSRQGTRDASTPGPLPPGSRYPVYQERPAGTGTR